MTNEILHDPELQRILMACLDYWSTEPVPPAERFICYKWVVRRHQARFGAPCSQPQGPEHTPSSVPTGQAAIHRTCAS